MHAKFVYEAMGDILKGKSEKEIISSIENENLDPNYLLVKSAEKGFLFGVKKALEIGADIHYSQDYALRWASEYGHLDVVELLLNNSADVHANYNSPLEWALENNHYDVVELLKKYM